MSVKRTDATSFILIYLPELSGTGNVVGMVGAISPSNVKLVED